MEWAEYYERFYDWANSAQITRISSLSSFGPSDEICEVALEIGHETAATRLIKKAVAAGVVFTTSEVMELMEVLNKAGMDCAVDACPYGFTSEQLEELDGAVSDEVRERAAKRSGIDLDADPEEEQDADYYEAQPPQRKLGFFGALAIALGVGGLLDDTAKRHTGRCNGDCAHCPPHYGYRYGRWYYGHNHQHGCEFGGNKGL